MMEFQVFKSHRIPFYPLCPSVSVILFGSVNEFLSPIDPLPGNCHSCEFHGSEVKLWSWECALETCGSGAGIYAGVITGISWFPYTYNV